MRKFCPFTLSLRHFLQRAQLPHGISSKAGRNAPSQPLASLFNLVFVACGNNSLQAQGFSIKVSDVEVEYAKNLG